MIKYSSNLSRDFSYVFMTIKTFGWDKKIVDLQDFPEKNKFSFFSGFVLPPRLTIRSELLVWAAIEMDVRLL